MTLNSGKNESRRILNLTEMPASKTQGIEQRKIDNKRELQKLTPKKKKKQSWATKTPKAEQKTV